MSTQQQDLRPGEEQALGGLLREMAPAPEPAPEVRERIRQAVAAEWRRNVQAASVPATVVALPARPRRRWQGPSLALAAGLAVAAVALGVLQLRGPAASPTVATLTRVSGPVEAVTGDDGDWQPASVGQPLQAGRAVVTGPRGRAALSLAGGVTLRLDVNTRLAMASADRVVVERGAVYLDSGSARASTPALRIDTAFGSTRHLGTQYEVRVQPQAMQVSVREGRVATTLESAATPVVAAAGEQLVISADGAVARGTVDRRDVRWAWIADVTPPYAIEDRPLADFLAWASRETGRELVYASPEIEANARALILRGSIAGLTPDDALAAVMATTKLVYADEGGRLLLSLQPDAPAPFQ